MEEYLKELNLSEAEQEIIMKNNPKAIIDELKLLEKLVLKNYKFLDDYGIKNTKSIFLKYSEIFLQEPSIFKRIFTKYNKTDLVEKLDKNIDLVVLL